MSNLFEAKGILDPEGKNNNPLTNTEYSNEYKKWAEIWKKFPAYEKRKEIITNLDKSQVNIIVSGTGSGKTVLLPKFLLHVFNYNKKIAITLPKQIITQSAAEFAAKTLDVKLGEYVGFKYRGSPSNMYSKNTNLLYATDGTIVAKLLNDPELKEFDGVIIDEAHERKIQIDFLLFLLRKTVQLRKDFKLVIMSATINTQIFVDYFKDYNPFLLDVGSKTNYPIESIFLKENINEKEILNKGYEIINDIISKNEFGDILFFVNSSKEAKDVCKKFLNDKETFCIEVYSGMDQQQQDLAQDSNKYKELGNYKRKLVIATNVAESSLTIDGIEYVIDSGLELTSSYDPVNRAKTLDKKRISLAQIKQRMGRAGRTKPGSCYHLYTKDVMEKVSKFPLPSIRKEDVTPEVLKILSYHDVQTYPKLMNIFSNLIEPPREQYMKVAGNKLMEMGLMDRKLNITKLGNLISNFNFDINQTLMLLIAKQLNCSYEILKIITILDVSKNNVKELFNDPTTILMKNNSDDPNFERRVQSLKKKFKSAIGAFKHKYGDHFSLLKIFEKYLNQDKNKRRDWTYKYFLKDDILNKATKFYYKNKSNFYSKLNKIKIKFDLPNELYRMPLEDKITYVLGIGLYDKKAQLGKKIKLLFGPNSTTLNDNSFILLLSKTPSNLVYEELFILMDKPEINILSKIPNKIKDILPSEPSRLSCHIEEAE